MSGFAWVTLATNDSYSLGALVLAHSLRQVGTAHQLAVLVTPGVTNPMRQKLATVFNVVQEVNILDSKDEINLRLLKRPELGITFTKLHCWRLTQFEKCVFLDADTLVLVNSDELFEREEFSAAPDVGWPDCFNSGVFVYRPSNGTYGKLVEFAVEKGSFDGGDQGLLNLFFSDWAHKDISKHLPFIYNMCSTASYSYLPAFKQFGADVKIVHFIGPAKPWLQYFDTETRKVHPSPGLQHLQDVLQRWWDIFCSLIHPNLTPDMTRSRAPAEHISPHNPPNHAPSPSSYHSPPPMNTAPSHENYSERPDYFDNSVVEKQHDFSDVVDPWDEYDLHNQNHAHSHVTETKDVPNTFHENETLYNNYFQSSPHSVSQEVHYDNHSVITNHQTLEHHHSNTSLAKDKDFTVKTVPGNDNERLHNFSYDSHASQLHVENNFHSDKTSSYRDSISNYSSQDTSTNEIPPQSSIPHRSQHDVKEIETASHDSTSHHPPQQDTYVPVTPVIASHSSQRTPALPVECEATSTVPTEITSLHSTHNDDAAITDNSGLAGAFAQFTLGVKRTPTQDALENHLRRQGWEVGNIDYMGRDSFDNIWSKICETLASAPPQPQPVQPKSREPTPPSEPVAEKATASVTDTQQVESEKVESVPVVERIKESTLAEDIEKEKVLAEGPPKLESGDVQEVSKPEPIEKAEEEPKVEQAPQVEPESLTQLQEVPPTPKPDLVQELPEPPKAEEASKLLEPESPKVEETPSQVTAEPTAEPKPEGLQEVPVAEEPKPVEKTTATAESVALKPEEPAVLDEPPKLEEPVKQEVSAPKAEELPKPEEAPKIDEPVKPEEPPKPEEPQKTKPEETPKLEDLPKPEEPPKLEESPKPEEPPKQEEPPKPEEPPKLEELPKPEEPPKQEEPPKPEESSKQEEPQKQEEPPKQEERPKQEEPPKPEEVLKQEPIVPVAKAETPQAVPKPEVSQESPLQVQEVSPAVEGVPKSEAQQEIQKVVAPKKSVEPESAKQKPEVKSSETEKKKEGGAAAEKVQEPAEEAEKPKEAKPKEKKVIKKVVKKVPKADPAQQESSEPAKPSSAAAKPTESETPPAEGSSDATPTPPPRKTTIVKKVKPKK